MSLATRCPACGTVFRVVRDQLKVSEGWVRCGRCAEVFNAGQRLFDLEAEVALAAPPGQPSAPEAPVDDTSSKPAPAPGTASASESEPVSKPEPEPTHKPVAEAIGVPQQPSLATGAHPEPIAEAAAQPEAGPAHDAPAATPGFVVRADRAARRRHPARRSLLAGLALVLAALLAAQIALNYRDDLAAGWPASKRWLQAACGLLGCSVEAPRRIDSLGVDSSGLVRVEGSTYYRLSLVVQNRAPVVVRMPAIELTLTDTQGQTMARRVLRAAELGNDAPSLPAHGELALNAMLELGEQRVAGYTVELFYP
jgi:predicted Zn finger-like uncharacterized protein